MVFFDSIKIKESSVMGVPKEFEVSGGLTKREFFAGLAMQGLLASSYTFNSARETTRMHEMVDLSRKYADSLIEELECQKPIK
jgi:hypothetical protein